MEIGGCPVPEDRLYDVEQDVWLRLDPDGRRARLGVGAWLAAFAGRFLAVTFRPLEGPIARGRSVATLESARYTGAVRLPAAATVVRRNEAILARPKLVNDRPYDEGWIVEVELADPAEPPRTMRTAASAAPAVAEKAATWHVRCFPEYPDSELVEVGSECQAALAHLTEEIGRRAPGEVVLLVTDDVTAPVELARWEDRTGHRVIHRRREGELYYFLVRREAGPVPRG
jgi:glycine cleavage system H protein